MSTLEIFLLGLLGGVLPDLLQLLQAGNREKMPDYFKKPWWWVTFVLTVLIGGLAAVLSDADSALSAIAFGFAGPEVLRRLVGATVGTPAPARTRVAMTDMTAREYLA